MRRAARVVFASSTLTLLAGLPSCATEGSREGATAPRAMFESALTLPLDPTVHGARFVPLGGRTPTDYGPLPDGSRRAMLRGFRIVESREGGMRVSSTRLPNDHPIATRPLPERMGGGALFAIDRAIYRADDWLGEATQVFTASASVSAIDLGLDRVYVRVQNGSTTAMNPRTGERMDLGPWPKSPIVGAANGRGYVAADAWRAAAIADFYGVMLTTDAGETWKPIALPIDAKELRLADGKILAGDAKKPGETWFEIRSDGSAARADDVAPSAPAASEEANATERTVFGASPLESAILDGWPLGDGTAIVARDGQLARVRLDGGVIVDSERHAFASNPARCKAIPLGDFREKGSFGFLCAEPDGKTSVYAFDAARGAVSLVREWKRPRVVLAAGNGALAVRGGCDEDAKLTEDNANDYCVMSPQKKWHPVRVTHDPHDAQKDRVTDRVVALRDGTFAIVTPPTIDGTGARITLLSDKGSKTIALHFPDQIVPDAARVLRAGVWLDGMEEIEDNVIGGWVEAAGVMLGVRIAIDGTTDVGQFIRDAGAPMVSGRYGFGWTSGKRGFETVDFGHTWTAVEIPDHDSNHMDVRGCSPLGCVGPEWLRIGWGVVKPVEMKHAISSPSYLHSTTRLVPLACEPIAPAPTLPHVEAPRTTATREGNLRISIGFGVGSLYSRDNYAPTLFSSPFYATAAPTVRAEDHGYSSEASELSLTRGANFGGVERTYLWGPRSTDLDPSNSHLVFRWLSPFSGWENVRSSRATAAPQDLIDWYKQNIGSMQHTFIPGDTDDHGLLVSRRASYSQSTSPTLTVLETDHAPMEIRRADNEPFIDIEAAMHTLGHWYLVTPSASNERHEDIVWRVDGAVARELTRVRRAGFDGKGAGTKLARREGGRTIGLVVDGQPLPDGSTPMRWVLPIDVENGATGEPESIGANDFSDRKEIGPCRNLDDAWIFDTAINTSSSLHLTDGTSWSTGSSFVRARVTHESACLEEIASMINAPAEQARHTFTHARVASHREGAIRVTVLADRMRYALSCVAQ